MDIDLDLENGVDAGALEDDNDDDYGLNPTQQRRRKRKKTTMTNTEEEEHDNTAPPNLHPDDPANFLKLCAALKILVSPRAITEEELTLADNLIREYGLELTTVSCRTSRDSLCYQQFIQLYGPEVIRPNHHYATHMALCVRNYGPLYEFWTFLFERLNKVLKSYKTPNHAGALFNNHAWCGASSSFKWL